VKCQRQLLQISWQQFIRNDEVAATTGLPSISEVISHRPSALFDVRSCHETTTRVPAHKVLHCHVDLSLSSGNAARVDPERDGSTRSERSTESPRRTCGGERRVVVTDEQRYGPP